MFSALCEYFYGVRGPLSRSEMLFFVKKSSKNPEHRDPPWLADCMIYIIISADIGRYIENRIFDQNRDFCDFHVFSTLHNMADHMAGNAKKCDQRPEMVSLSPQNMYKYLGRALRMIWSHFKKSSKIMFFA